MIECSKCKIDKPKDQYQTYWHSTQNTFRTRRYCKDCFRKQKQEWKNKKKLEQNPDLQYENHPDYTQCRKCQVWKHKNDYYLIRGKISYTLCKSCSTQKERAERQEYLKENCGSDFVHKDPNHFTDEYQKECVFAIMRELGYLYDESTGIWTKPNIKELVDGQLVFHKLKKKAPKEKRKRLKSITVKHINTVLELRKNGLKILDIVEKTGVSENSVYRIIKTYGNKAH